MTREIEKGPLNEVKHQEEKTSEEKIEHHQEETNHENRISEINLDDRELYTEIKNERELYTEIKNERELFSEIRDDQYAIIFISANWCLPCQRENLRLERMLQELPSLRVFKIPYDQCHSMTVGFRVNSIPHFEMVKKIDGHLYSYGQTNTVEQLRYLILNPILNGRIFIDERITLNEVDG